MATQTAPDRWLIEGQELKIPVHVRDARLGASVYRPDLEAVSRNLEGTPFKPLKLGRRGIAVLVLVKYVDGDLGTYDEFALAVGVRGPGGKPGLCTLHLPVTAAFTRAAGRAVWGLPKYLVAGSLIDERRQMRFTLSDGDDFMIAGCLQAGLRLPGRWPGSMAGWSVGLEGVNEGAVLRTRSRAKVSGLRLGRQGPVLQLGDHAMGQAARELGLGKRPVLSFLASDVQFEIGGSETR